MANDISVKLLVGAGLLGIASLATQSTGINRAVQVRLPPLLSSYRSPPFRTPAPEERAPLYAVETEDPMGSVEETVRHGNRRTRYRRKSTNGVPNDLPKLERDYFFRSLAW